MGKKIAMVALFCVGLLFSGFVGTMTRVSADESKAASTPGPKPTNTRTHTPTKTFTPTKTHTPTKTYTPTRTPTDTRTPTGTPTPKVQLPPLYVAKVDGEAYLVHKGDKKKPDVPQKVEKDDEIITGKDGTVYLQFKDGGTMEIGPSSDIQIKDLDIHGTDFKAKFSMLFGKLRTIIHKLETSSSSFEVEAGGVVTGVRGTTFEVDYDKEKDVHTTKTYDGTVFTRANGKEEDVHKGFSLVVGHGIAPALGPLGAGDIADFVAFLDASDKLEAAKQILLKKLEERLINEALHQILGGGKKDHGIGLQFGF
ncbi:MAG TPA: FecR family protein [bacterium]|nr:FecR family protein [bacterium]